MAKRKQDNPQRNYKRIKRGTGYSQTSRQTKFIRALMKTEERKYIDTYGSLVACTTAGIVTTLNSIAEGSDFNQRIGRKTRGMYLQYDIGITSNATTVVGDWTWHLVLDRQPNGTAATAGQIFDLSNSSATYAFKNLQLFAERFKILKTEIGKVAYGTNNTSFDGTGRDRCRGFIDLSSMPDNDKIVQFGGSGGSVPNCNALYLVAMATNNTLILMSYNLRFVYTDM